MKQPKLSKNRKKEKNKLIDLNVNHELSSHDYKVLINNPLSIQDLSKKIHIPETEIITYLFLAGMPVTINQVIDIAIAKDIAEHYKFTVIDSIALEDENKPNGSLNIQDQSEIFNRSPVIVVFGHVDHGKTTLLDTILKINSSSREYGGITQAINGYEMHYTYCDENVNLVFLDTPGHEAFSSMRIRSAKVADIALLIIAADDGLQPQTLEAIKLILDGNISHIVVITKVDKNDADVNSIKQKLTEYNMISKDWGGSTDIVEVSSFNNYNIDKLMDKICLINNEKQLQAHLDNSVVGTILESYLDKKKGVVARCLIQNGILKVGDFIASGSTAGRVKSLISFDNNSMNISGPSSLVQILGFFAIPEAGLEFVSLKNDKECKDYVKHNKGITRQMNMSRLLNSRISPKSKGNIKQFNVIVKSDTQGSLEAIIKSFFTISQNKVQLNLIANEAGNISRSDIDLALASNATIIGFNVTIMPDIVSLVKRNGLMVETFKVIYDLLDYVNQRMLDLLDIEYESVIIGQAVVQTVFSVNKGIVAGCLVNEGKLRKSCHINIYRNKQLIYKGILNSLKRIKEDVLEVISNNECGVMCNDYHEWQVQDIIEAYELKSKDKIL
uniref:Translation initiation factor IF-2, chloroplastic n=1 Tax=Anotrichium furcellatum TaxID=41999 RepID=A0A4D6WK37_9FLOR|nr:Translation initiation factor 2 [Anotrichium furcellatum]